MERNRIDGKKDKQTEKQKEEEQTTGFTMFVGQNKGESTHTQIQ